MFEADVRVDIDTASTNANVMTAFVRMGMGMDSWIMSAFTLTLGRF